MFLFVSLIFHLFLWNDEFYWVRWFHPFATVKIRMFAAIHDHPSRLDGRNIDIPQNLSAMSALWPIPANA